MKAGLLDELSKAIDQGARAISVEERMLNNMIQKAHNQDAIHI